MKVEDATEEVSKPWVARAYSVCVPIAGVVIVFVKLVADEFSVVAIGLAKLESSSESSTERLGLAEYPPTVMNDLPDSPT